jgi:hypothetical protein
MKAWHPSEPPEPQAARNLDAATSALRASLDAGPLTPEGLQNVAIAFASFRTELDLLRPEHDLADTGR